MYNPLERLHAFYPPLARNRDVSEKEISGKPRYVRGSKKIRVVIHIVDAKQHSEELRASTMGTMIAIGSAKTEKQAATYAKMFGTGNLLVYSRCDNLDHLPIYIGVGVTTGCSIDGLNVRGTWDIIDDFKENNPFTHLAMRPYTSSRFYNDLHFDIGNAKIKKIKMRAIFVKVLLPDAVATMQELAGDARAFVTAKGEFARTAIIVKLLFTYSEASAEKLVSRGLQCFVHG